MPTQLGVTSRVRRVADRFRRALSPLAVRQAASTAGRALLWPYTVDTELRELSGSTIRPLSLASESLRPRRPSAPTGADADRLVALLRTARRHLWIARSLVLAGRLLLVLAIAVLLVAVARLLDSRLLTMVAIPIGALLAVLGLVAIAFQRVTDLDAARVLDRRLGLAERLGTSVGLLRQNESGAFATYQLREAADLVAVKGARWNISLRWPRRDLARGGFALLLSATLLAASAVSPPRSSVDGPAANAAQRAEEIQTGDWTEVVNEDNTSLDLRAEDPATAARLAELKRQLETGEISAQQYADRVAALEDGLRQRAAESARQQESLARLAEALKDSSATRDVANSLNRGDYADAAKQMAALANQSDQLSQQARQELAERLASASEQVGDRSPKLANSAKQASESLRQGDRDAAANGLRDLADQMARAGDNVSPQSTMADALQQIQNAQTKADAQASQLAKSSQPGADQGEGSGQPQAGDQNGRGNAPGDKPQSAAGEGAEKGGGAGSGPGSRTIGRGDGQDSAASNQAVLRIDGKPTDAGSAQRQDTGGTPLTTTQSGVSSVRATDSFRQSTEPVNTVGEQNFVPFEMKPVVKDYFSEKPADSGQ